MNRLLLIGITIAMGTGSLPATASAQAPAAAAGAQAPAAAQAPTTTLEPGPPDHPATPPPAKLEPQQFLATAKQLLDAVPTNSLGKDGQKKLAQLRDDFKNLVANYQARSSTAVPTATDTAKDASDWKTKFDDVERALTSILGGGALLNTTSTTAVGTGGIVTSAPAGQPSVAGQPTGTSSPSQPAPTTGSSTTQPVGSSGAGETIATAGSTGAVLGGVAVEEIGVKNLDPGIRAQLEQVRRNIELFYDAGTHTLTNP